MKISKLLVLGALTSSLFLSACSGGVETLATVPDTAATITTMASEEAPAATSTAEPEVSSDTASTSESPAEEKTMVLKIAGTEVPVTWEDNASVKELKELAANGLAISMSMYGGFEQVGSIGQRITSSDKQTTTSTGDIVLYSSSQIVIFYGSNSWSYTRLGKIDLPDDKVKELLSKGDVTITLEIK